LARKARKIKDKWKEKKWVNVIAPDSFNNVNIGYVPITDDENAKGRILEVTLWDILKGDPSQHQYKIIFQIDEINDTKAKTVFKRYEYSKEFLRSLIRRGSSKVNFNIDIQTKDNYIFRIKMIFYYPIYFFVFTKFGKPVNFIVHFNCRIFINIRYLISYFRDNFISILSIFRLY